jgi:hypothetical protein
VSRRSTVAAAATGFLVAVLFAVTHFAGTSNRPQLGDQVTGSSQIQNPVEQQTPGFYGPCDNPQLPGWCQPDRSLWVMNLTGCIWDHDDFYRISTTGDLAAQTAYSLPECYIADWDHHCATINGQVVCSDGHVVAGGAVASVSNLLVTACVTPGVCLPVTVTQTARREFTYRFCTSIYAARDDPALEAIPDSNGGVGVPTTLTLRVRNQSSKVVRDVRVSESVGDDVVPVTC